MEKKCRNVDTHSSMEESNIRRSNHQSASQDHERLTESQQLSPGDYVDPFAASDTMDDSSDGSVLYPMRMNQMILIQGQTAPAI